MKIDRILVLTLCGLLTLATVGPVLANGALEGDEPAIMVTPRVLALTKAAVRTGKTAVLTVHSNLPLDGVDVAAGLSLGFPDGSAATLISAGADDLGALVAKFRAPALGDLASGPLTLTLTGAYVDGPPFALSAEIRVKLPPSAPGQGRGAGGPGSQAKPGKRLGQTRNAP